MTSPSIAPYTSSPLLNALLDQIEVCSVIRLAITFGEIEKMSQSDLANLQRGLAAAIAVKNQLSLFLNLPVNL